MRAARFAPCALLGLALAVVGCGSKAPTITGLNVTVRMSKVTADQLAFVVTTPDGTAVMSTRRPDMPSGTLADPQSVSIFLPDGLAGQVATCTATPLLSGNRAAPAGSATATLMLHELVMVTIDLNGGQANADGGAGAGGSGGSGGAGGATDGGAVAGAGGNDGGLDGPGTKGLGAPCASDTECDSTLCVDGVCCASTCGSLCQACNLTGHEGTCTPLPSGMAPPATATQCAPELVSNCGFDGTCDGNGGCRRYPPGTQCLAASCNGASYMPASACDGQGTCVAQKSVSCAPYMCGGTTPGCLTTCGTGGAGCVLPAVCSNGSCGTRPKQAIGAGCVADTDCSSGHCADGVCCGDACAGACTSCNQAGLGGMCLPVPAGKADPHSVCKDAGAATCMANGLCDGAGACALYPAATPCGAGSCTKNSTTLHPAQQCDGKGSCVAPADVNCTPFRCNPMTTACFTSCQFAGLQCAPRHNCMNMICQ
jgi:hypothetical protein